MLSQYKDKFRAAFEGVARVFMKLGFTPNRLTVFALFLGIGVCVIFVITENAVLFGMLMITIGMLDVIDGTLARMTDRVTKFGSYLDAMCDRLYEAAALLASAYVSGHWVLSFVVMTGAILTSYAKARAGMEVSISNTEWPDMVERFERSVIFTLGVILWGCFPGKYGGHDLYYWTLVLLTLVIYAGLGQRMMRAKRIIEERGT